MKLVWYLEQSSLEEFWLGAWRASRVWSESLNEAWYHCIWLDASEEVLYGWRFCGAVASGVRSGIGGGMAWA